MEVKVLHPLRFTLIVWLIVGIESVVEHGIPVVKRATSPFHLPVGVAGTQSPGIEVDVVLGKVYQGAGICGTIGACHTFGAYQRTVAQFLEACVHAGSLLVESVLTTIVVIVMHVHQTFGVLADEA